MANNPDLHQIFFGGLWDEVRSGARPRSDSSRAPCGGRSEGRRVTELGVDGGPRHSRKEAHGGDRRRVGGGGHRDEHGDHPYRHEPYGRDGGLPRRQDAPARRGGTTASGTSGAEYTGDSARRSRTRGRGTPSGLSTPKSRDSSRERSRSASDRDRQYAQRNFPVSNGRGDARRGHGGRPGAAASAAERRIPERNATCDDDHKMQGRGPPPSRGTPHGAAATTPGPPRRRPTDTHVNQEQRDAAHDKDRVPALGRGALVSASDAREALRAADWEGPPRHWDGRLFCGRDAMVLFTSTCAACFLWREFKNTRLPCRHQPSDPYPTGAHRVRRVPFLP